MKKGKVIGKSHIALAVMVVALAGAVWLNMRYSNEEGKDTSNSSSKYLGQAEYVNGEVEGEESLTPSEVYFSNMRKKRAESREEAIAVIEDTLENAETSEENKKQAMDKAASLAARGEKETAIETLLLAKGFGASVVIIGDEDVNVILKCNEILPAETIQVQDAVLSQTDFSVSDIKIITVSDSEIENALK